MNTHLALQMTILILVRYETLGIKKKFQAVLVVALLLLLQSAQHLYQSEQIRPDRFVSRQLHVELSVLNQRVVSSAHMVYILFLGPKTMSVLWLKPLKILQFYYNPLPIVMERTLYRWMEGRRVYRKS